jgi:hypothetical protein
MALAHRRKSAYAVVISMALEATQLHAATIAVSDLHSTTPICATRSRRSLR